MITLCGFPVSNYYNKVKLALLEKGVPFQEEVVMTGRTDEDVISASPLGKIPFVRTPQGPLCESMAILEYIEAAHPTPALLPSDPFAAAKVRELIIFINLHLELVARELYRQAFFGGTVGDDVKERVRQQLARNIPAFKRLARFAPWAAGDTFTLADCAAYVSLPLVGMSTRLVLGGDLLAEHGVDWKAYGKKMAERASVQRVDADRKAYLDKAAAAKA